MNHPAEQAAMLLRSEVDALLSDKSVRPGTVKWFVLQAKGCGLSMLNGMVQVGAHNDPVTAEIYRKSIPVKGIDMEVPS